MTRRDFHRTLAGVVLTGPLLATGCSSDIKIVKVSGTVRIDGKPVTYGKVQMMPVGYRAAYGIIGPDGRFTMMTSDDGDGVVLGTHPVAIIAHETKGPGAQIWHAPKQYIDAATTGLTVTIEGPTDNLEINLTWKDSGHTGPFTERNEKE